MCYLQITSIRPESPNVEFGTENFDHVLWIWNELFFINNLTLMTFLFVGSPSYLCNWCRFEVASQ